MPELKNQHLTLIRSGFDRIMGLKDMLGREYTRITRAIDPALMAKLRSDHQSEINKLKNPHITLLHFSVMEVEAWILAVPELFERADARLTKSQVNAAAGMDLAKSDPESKMPAPAAAISRIMSSIGRRYRKGYGAELFLDNLTQVDVNALLKSGRCPSFRRFYLDLFGLL